MASREVGREWNEGRIRRSARGGESLGESLKVCGEILRERKRYRLINRYKDRERDKESERTRGRREREWKREQGPRARDRGRGDKRGRGDAPF